MFNQGKSSWNSSAVFLIAMIGAVLSLTSLTQFSYIMYGNGGGAFLIPYIIAIVLIGVPFLCLEFGAGFKFKSSISKILFNIKGEYEYLGWFIIFIMFLLLAIYICIMGWDLIYMVLALFKGWGANPDTFFNQSLLHSSTDIYSLTYLIVPIGITVMVIWGVIYLISRHGIDLIAKVNMVLVPVMIILLVAVFIFVLTLAGSKIAMSLIIHPDWSCLLDYHVWLIAFTQVISVLLLGQAVASSYSSYLDGDGEAKVHLVDNAWIIALVSFAVQIVFTLIIFGLLGAMVEVNPLVNTEFTNTFTLIFVLIPNAFNTMGIWGNIIGFAFFLLLFIAGLSSAIGIIEPFVSSAVEKFSITRTRALRYICVIGIFASFVFTTGMGQYLITVVSQFLMNFAILLAILLELVIIAWVYGADRLMDSLNEGSSIKVDSFWIICIKFITPIILIILLVLGVYNLISTGNHRTLFIDSIVAVIFVIAPLVLTLNLIDNDRFDLNLNLDLHTPGPSKPKAEFTEDGSFVSPYKDKKDKRNGKNVLFNVDLSSSEFDSPSETTLDDFEDDVDDESTRGKSVFGKINMFNKAKEKDSFDLESNENLDEDKSDLDDKLNLDLDNYTKDLEDDDNDMEIIDEESKPKKSRFSLLKDSITKNSILKGSKEDDDLDEFINENDFSNHSSLSVHDEELKLNSTEMESITPIHSTKSKSRFKKATEFDFDLIDDDSDSNSSSDSDSEGTIDISKLQSDYKEAKEKDDKSDEDSKPKSKSKKSKKSKESKKSKSNKKESVGENISEKEMEEMFDDKKVDESEIYQDFTDDFFDDGVFGEDGYESLLDDYDKKSNKSKNRSNEESQSKTKSKTKSKAKAKINRVKGKPKTITISADNFDESKDYDFENKGADSVFNLDE